MSESHQTPPLSSPDEENLNEMSALSKESSAPSPETSTETSASTKAPAKNKVFRSGLLTVIVAVLLVLFVSVEFFSDSLIAWSLRNIVSDQTGSKIEVEKANASLIGQSLSLSGLKVSPKAADQTPLLEAQEARADVALFKMISGKVWIDELSVTQSVVQLIRDESGQFNFDPGPPPSTETPDPEEEPAEEYPDEDRDVVQEIGDLLERLRTYRDYYEKIKGDDSPSESEEDEDLRRYPGRASYLATEIEAETPRFWLKNFAIDKATIKSRDQRTGEAILPEFKDLVFQVTNASDLPESLEKPMTVEVAGTPEGSGPWNFLYKASFGNRKLNLLDLSLEGVPLSMLTKLVSKSLPFDLQGGTLSIQSLQRKAALKGTVPPPSGPLQFDLKRLKGAVSVSLQNVRLEGAKGDSILGFPVRTFAELFNYAISQVPLELVFSLDGRPGSPKIELLNGRELLENLRDIASQAAETRLRELAAQVTDRLESEIGDLRNRARSEIDNIKGSAEDLLNQGRSSLEEGLESGLQNVEGTIGNALDGTPLEGVKNKTSGRVSEKAEGLLEKVDKIGDTEKVDKKLEELLSKPDKSTKDLNEALDEGIGKLFGKKKKDRKKEKNSREEKKGKGKGNKDDGKGQGKG